ncbi:MAG TPA: hemerythrin domain-containing protein [Acidimicrobiales bacterium]|nr:hemerythrin domain-containing protein [Acidimicrobiales bacterium]
MPDVTRLILDDHETLRRRFADLDDAQASGDLRALRAAWEPLADLLDLHAEAEEQVFYPKLLVDGSRPRAEDETEDAIEDHNKIRQGVRDAARHAVGSDGWWEAVGRARRENSKHIAEEEREALSNFRLTVPLEERYALGLEWIRFHARHGGESDVEGVDKDADRYIAQHDDAASPGGA